MKKAKIPVKKSKYFSDTHESVFVPEVQAQIDVALVPVIKFLNSLPDVRTEYCCQGGAPNPGLYIVFRVEEISALPRVLRFFATMPGYVDVNFDTLRGLRFSSRPHYFTAEADTNALKRLLEHVEMIKEIEAAAQVK